jgi:hypothetical protein
MLPCIENQCKVVLQLNLRILSTAFKYTYQQNGSNDIIDFDNF